MTSKTRIYLIRHGEVAGGGTGVRRYNGHTDVPLTDHGKAQYLALRERFAAARITACYTSDLSRCVWGAETLGAHLNVVPVRHPELRELCMGEWEARSWQELQECYPAEWQARLADLVNYRVPGGENLLDVRRRVMPVIDGIVARHRDEEVLVVAHGGVNRLILLEALGAPLSSLFAIDQHYACLNIIDYYADGNAVVKLVNG
ncbi:alpha-ribazole phosphatase [Geotalea uraniireducens]|uniref:Alpha-ribazole phosphatase n=1 Tax=Geotalea uraniireducens TaxID=351604 RepID=A0ABM8EPL7_9BACT|nr:alpha-ribazole phosphatase [Geotalea uraniireducens]BDV44409.1 alpha-ribazole phosphatase [Geotalea uraniireducens]